jgi:WD40 repeat protein
MVRACAWAPDGSALVTTSWDYTARVWNAEDWRCLATLTGHTSYVTACAWAPDGSALVTTSEDLTARVWSDI